MIDVIAGGCEIISLPSCFLSEFRLTWHTVATGTGKVAITITNLVALASYIASGNIMYQIAIPATISNMIVGYVGAILAAKKGKAIIKRITSLKVKLSFYSSEIFINFLHSISIDTKSYCSTIQSFSYLYSVNFLIKSVIKASRLIL